MSIKTKPLGWLALATFVVLPGLGDAAQGQQGPVREGLRGTAEATGQAIRRTGEATRNVVGGVAQGTAEAARRTGEAARNAGQNTREALRGTTQPNRGRYESGYRGDTQQENWYPSETNQGYVNSGQVHQLRHDCCGREFICLNGRRVYFTNQAAYQQAQPEQANSQEKQTAHETNRPILEEQSPESTEQAQSDSQASSDDTSSAQPSENQAESQASESQNSENQASDNQAESTPESESAKADQVEPENTDVELPDDEK